MRKIVYLLILIVVLVAGTLMLRKYHQSIPLPDILTAAVEEDESSVASDYLAANVAQKSGDIKGAVKYFEKALSKDPKNDEIVQRLYGLYLFNGQYESSIELAKRQAELDKQAGKTAKDLDPITYLLIALHDFKNKDIKSIPPLLEPIADPKVPNRTHIDGVMIPMVLVWAYTVDEKYLDAFRVIDQITSDYMSSIFSFNRALVNDIANNKKVLVEGKNYSPHERAEKLLSDVFFEIGRYSLQSGQVEEAVVYVRLARYLDPDSYKLKKMLAVSLESLGKLEEAITVYSEIPESSENYGDTLLSMALLYHGLKDNENSFKTLERLKDIPGYEYKAIFGMGTIKMSDSKYDEAIKLFEDALVKIGKPTREDWNIFFNLGVAYEKKDNWPKAEENLKKAVQLYPENPESLNYLAYSWLIRNQNIKQARAMLEAAVIRSGGAPHILDSYGWALYKLGYYKEAIPFLEQAVNGMPYSTVINDHLGDTYWKAGRKREAKFQWKKALDVFDKDQDITPEITKEQLQKKIESGLE